MTDHKGAPSGCHGRAMGAERAKREATSDRAAVLDGFARELRDRPESAEWEHVARALSGVEPCSCAESLALACAVRLLLDARDEWAKATRVARRETAGLRLEAMRIVASLDRCETTTAGELRAALERIGGIS